MIQNAKGGPKNLRNHGLEHGLTSATRITTNTNINTNIITTTATMNLNAHRGWAENSTAAPCARQKG